MKRQWGWCAGLIVLAVVFQTGRVYAQTGGASPEEMAPPEESSFQERLQALNLTDEQKDKLILLLMSEREPGRSGAPFRSRMRAHMSKEGPEAEGEGGPPEDKDLHGARRFAKVFEELGLSAEQQQALKDNRTENRGKNQKIREEMRTQRELLREELAKDDLDMEKVQKIHEDLKALLGRLEDNKLNGILAVRKILTPAQFQAFHQKMGKRMQGKGRFRRSEFKR